MAIQGSGAISFSDLAEEFGDTAPHSFSEFYRDGSLVPGVNSNVAASGAIRLGTFYNAVNELLQTVTSSASINAQTIFGSDWGTNIPKRLSIPSGVTIGPLTIPTGMGGSLEVDVAGNVYGTGGSANGGAGGHAITANSSFTLNVLSGGSVRGGGGGGGRGGTGGNGSYTQQEGPVYNNGNRYFQAGQWEGRWGYGGIFYGNPYSSGGWTYRAGSIQGSSSGNNLWSIYRTRTVSTTGGAGGNGGVGQGYNQSSSSGASGSAGGTNAGTGGTGGSGGGYATAGSTGSTGSNGNSTNGSSGSGGGAAGKAVQMNAGTVTVNNSGTINGAY